MLGGDRSHLLWCDGLVGGVGVDGRGAVPDACAGGGLGGAGGGRCRWISTVSPATSAASGERPFAAASWLTLSPSSAAIDHRLSPGSTVWGT
jgi:hypothetical protein